MATRRGRISVSALKHHVAVSDVPYARSVRRLRRRLGAFSLPVPRAVARLALHGYLAARALFHAGKRVLVCQPLFAAYCRSHGPGLRTGCFVHWVQGSGDIVLGDHVTLDGKSTITFAASFSDRPVLSIGDHTRIGHDTDLTIGKRITIGRHCHISGATRIFDSNGHPTSSGARRTGAPPRAGSVRPVTIGDDVWIAKNCLIFPGVTIGDGAIVSAGSVVREDVPPYAVVAGNPARIVRRMQPEARVTDPSAAG